MLMRFIKCLACFGLAFLYLTTAQAAQVTLAWDAVTASNLGGYKVYYGQKSGNYTSNIDVGKQTTYTVANLQDGATYYFAVTDYDSARTMESGFSNEVSKTFSSSSSSGGSTSGGSTSSGSGSLSSPWLDMDIGNVGITGSASYASGTFTLKGSGSDIWNTTDAFHFVYQPLSGDGTIVARVASIANTHSWAKAGVMIRENLDSNARYAMVAVTAGNGVAFQRRTATGGSSSHTAGAAVGAPYWVKLVRSGNTFTAYQSANGSTWVAVGSASISMSSSAYVGLALTSHDNNLENTATIDNVNISASSGGSSNSTEGSGTSSGGSSSSTGGSDAFQQGYRMVVMEAEDYQNNTPLGGHSWQPSSYNYYAGTGALQAMPDDYARVDAGSGPRLDYPVQFSRTGTHYVWVRILGLSNRSNSLYVGLDGDISSAVPMSQPNTGDSWVWTDLNQSGAVATINVPSTGVHTVNVWMRESGTGIDKLLLTTDGSYVPSGSGPSESAQN